MWQLVKVIYSVIAIIFGLLIIVKSLGYFYPDFSQGFLSDKESVFNGYKYYLYAHIVAAPIAFFVGGFQLAYPKTKAHKILGWIYVCSIILFAAPGGFYMAFFAIGGAISTINFALMAILWIYFTLNAFLKIKAGDIQKHQQYMTRSFILTNSAILIRLFSFVNNHYGLIDVTMGYIVISWISWLPWLLIYEWTIRRNNRFS
tara:strand:+ start:4188 stop:4793 length:606 start_codon:yes stop_codon:yes gene_type:complete